MDFYNEPPWKKFKISCEIKVAGFNTEIIMETSCEDVRRN